MSSSWLSLRKSDGLRIFAADTVRISAFFFCAALCLGAPSGLRAQNPGAQQDAEAAEDQAVVLAVAAELVAEGHGELEITASAAHGTSGTPSNPS